MPFQRKNRRCKRFDGKWIFKPTGKRLKSLKITIIKLDELEAMRLCDSENLSQKDAADRMEISTGTLQRLVYSARKKIVDTLCCEGALELHIPNNIKFEEKNEVKNENI